MRIPAQAMTVINWSQVGAKAHPGESGAATWRTQQIGDIRIRMVEYSPGYLADHWCTKGHVIFCVAGSLHIELRDGTRLATKAGESYAVGDGEPAHRSSTREGARLFIVD
jgi:hypothetical protein